MQRYIKECVSLSLLAIFLLLVTGCEDGGFRTESRLGISSVEPSNIQSDVVETTDDYGTDGESGTNDADGTENNNRPDPGEEILTDIEADTAKITFTNTIREGSEDGTDIKINRYVITYYDENDVAPAYAPRKNGSMTLVVAPGATASIDLEIVPVEMKKGWTSGAAFINGVRWYFLYEPQNFDDTLYAQIDFYGRDVTNNKQAIAVAYLTIIFSNLP